MQGKGEVSVCVLHRRGHGGGGGRFQQDVSQWSRTRTPASLVGALSTNPCLPARKEL